MNDVGVGMTDTPTSPSELLLQIAELQNRLRAVTYERDVAIKLLAGWVVLVQENGSSWDDWDEAYKDAAFRPNAIRNLLDKEIGQQSLVFKGQQPAPLRNDFQNIENGQTVTLYPNESNPLHKQPIEAVYSDGYFFCKGSNHSDGPDYYMGDVAAYNDGFVVKQGGQS